MQPGTDSAVAKTTATTGALREGADAALAEPGRGGPAPGGPAPTAAASVEALLRQASGEHARQTASLRAEVARLRAELRAWEAEAASRVSDKIMNATASQTAEQMAQSEDRKPRIRRSRSSRLFSDHGASHEGVIRQWAPWLKNLDRLVKHPGFEVFFMALILANSACMAVEAEYLGYKSGQTGELPGKLGVGPQGWDNAQTIFEVVEYVFGCAFALEALLKLVVYGRLFFKQPWNLFDLFVVLMWVLEKVLPVIPVPALVLRLARLVKALRLVRLTRTLEFADTLNLIIVAVKASLSAFVWSLLLISIITLVIALVLNYGLKTYVENLLIAEDPRERIYIYFGTFWRSLLSVLELTLGNWVPITRSLQEDVSAWLAFGVVAYRLIMEIAILKVLTGVFLHETFRVAKSDHELMIRGKMRENKALKDQMAILFNDMDTHSTGKVHREDFQATFNHPRVSLYLAALGLSYKDANELWGVVMEEVGQTPSGGEVSTDDLTWAIGKIRGEGRSVNVVMALQQIRRLVAGLQESGLISAPLAGPHDPISRDLLDDSFVQGGCGPSETRVAEI